MKIISNINCDMGKFVIGSEDSNVSCFFNGSKVLSCSLEDLSSIVPIIGVLVSSACNKPDSEIKIIADSTNSDFIKDIQDTIGDSESMKIKVLKSKPDEIEDNKPVEARISHDQLDNYNTSIKNCADSVNDTLDLLKILSKTKLPKSILSSTELNNKIENMKTSSLTNVSDYSILSEQTAKDIYTLKIINKQRIASTLKKKIMFRTSHQIIKNYNDLKTVTATLLRTYYPMYNINSSFKQYTGYPATWYYDPSVFYNFVERYKDASDNLIELTKYDNSIIAPLTLVGRK
jgi:hypothetical protein